MNKGLLTSIVALFAIYFSIALYLTSTYASPPPKPKIYWLPYPPFPHLDGVNEGHAYLAWLHPSYDAFADDDENPARSTLLLFEDGKLIGPPHSSIHDIKKHGAGRYSHRKGVGLIFSPSDNGDPNAPWRKYHVQPALESIQSTGSSTLQRR